MSDDDSDYSSDASSDDEDQNDLNNPDIVTKYRMAGDFAKAAMEAVMKECKPGAKPVDLCNIGDAKILEQTAKVYTKPVEVDGKKEPVDKGIAFPTAVSLGGMLGNYSPGPNDDNKTVLAEGDLAKVELAVHIDGYVVSAAHTMVVGADGPLTGKAADTVLAARYACEAAMRCLRPGNKAKDIIKYVEKVSKAYEVEAAEGVKCNTIKRFVIEASKQMPIRETVDEKIEDFEIMENEVYAIEVAMTTSEDGKTSHKDGEVHIYRRAVDVTYKLKMKAARQVFSEIDKNYPSFAFNTKMLESKLGAAAKLGMREIVEHDLLTPYPVTKCLDSDDVVATFKVTCLVMSSGIIKLVDLPYPECESDKKIEDEETLQLLSRALKPKKKKKNKKKKAEA